MSDSTPSAHPRVFISYSHDSEAHRQRVLMLAERLRQDGYETMIDQYVEGTPSEGWPRWMLNRIDWADFVLLVCTTTYYRRFRGHEAPGVGKGVDWEGAVITNECYDSKSVSTRFVPILFNRADANAIPEPFRGSTFYAITDEPSYAALKVRLAGAAGIQPAPLGPLPDLKRKTGTPLEFPLGTPCPDVSSAPTTYTLGFADKLPYLCDRSAQEESLIALLEQVRPRPGTVQRPILCVVHGAEGEAHIEFLERLEKRFLPHYLQRLGLTERVEFLTLKECPETHDPAAFGSQLRRRLADELQLAVCHHDKHLVEAFAQRRTVVVAPTLHLSQRTAFDTRRDCLELLHQFWAAFPPLPADLFLIAFVSIKHLAEEPSVKPRGWRSLLPFAPKPPPPLDPRERIRAFITRNARPDAPVICHELPELESISFEHLNDWSLIKEVRQHFPRGLSDQQLRAILGHQPQRPMQLVIAELQKLLDAQPSATR